MRFLAALGFLTIIPLPRRWEVGTEAVGRSPAYFPLVGLIIGLLLAGGHWLLAQLLPLSVVNGLWLVSLVVITGALHLDGFIDTCDGLAAHQTVEDRWRVMHDSRAGAFGIIGVMLLLLVKYLALNSIPESLLRATLVLVPVVSRWAMVYALFGYPYARPTGLGKLFKQGTGRSSLALATVIALAAGIILAWRADIPFPYLAGLAIMVFAGIIASAMSAYLARKFAGLTGDTYGAISEVLEVAVLILISLLTFRGWIG